MQTITAITLLHFHFFFFSWCHFQPKNRHFCLPCAGNKMSIYLLYHLICKQFYRFNQAVTTTPWFNHMSYSAPILLRYLFTLPYCFLYHISQSSNLCYIILYPKLLLKFLYHKSDSSMANCLWRHSLESRLSAADLLYVPAHLNSKGNN